MPGPYRVVCSQFIHLTDCSIFRIIILIRFVKNPSSATICLPTADKKEKGGHLP